MANPGLGPLVLRAVTGDYKLEIVQIVSIRGQTAASGEISGRLSSLKSEAISELLTHASSLASRD